MEDNRALWRRVSSESLHGMFDCYETTTVLIHFGIMALATFAPSGPYKVNLILSGLGFLLYVISVSTRYTIAFRASESGKKGIQYVPSVNISRNLIFAVNVGTFIYCVVSYG